MPTPTAGSPGPTPTLAPGWTRHEVSAEGFAIALPEGWLAFNPSRDTLEDFLRLAGARNPQAERVLRGQLAGLPSGIKLVGIDASPDAATGDFAPNVNVIRGVLPADVSLDAFTDANVRQLEDNQTTVLKPIERRRARTAGGDATELRYRARIETPTGAHVDAAVTQVLAVSGRNAYVITLAVPAEKAERYAAPFEQATSSFRAFPIVIVTPSPSPAPTRVATPTAIAGWTIQDRRDDGFALAVPSEWLVFARGADNWQSPEEFARQVALKNERLAAIVRSQIADPDPDFRLFAWDPSAEATTRGYTGLNVVRSTLPVAPPLDFFAQSNLKEIEGMEGVVKPVAQRKVATQSGEAVEFRYTRNVPTDGGRTVPMAMFQYVAVDARTVLVLTMNTEPELTGKYAPIFERIAGSLRLSG